MFEPSSESQLMTKKGAVMAPFFVCIPQLGDDKLWRHPYDMHVVFIAPVLLERGNFLHLRDDCRA